MEWFKMRLCWATAVMMMTDEEAGRLLRTMLIFMTKREAPEPEGREQLVWDMIQPILAEDLRKYDIDAEKRARDQERRSRSASHAARARWSQREKEDAWA